MNKENVGELVGEEMENIRSCIDLFAFIQNSSELLHRTVVVFVQDTL